MYINIPDSIKTNKAKELYINTVSKLHKTDNLYNLDFPIIETMCIYFQKIQELEDKLNNPECKNRKELIKRYKTLVAKYKNINMSLNI